MNLGLCAMKPMVGKSEITPANFHPKLRNCKKTIVTQIVSCCGQLQWTEISPLALCNLRPKRRFWTTIVCRENTKYGWMSHGGHIMYAITQLGKWEQSAQTAECRFCQGGESSEDGIGGDWWWLWWLVDDMSCLMMNTSSPKFFKFVRIVLFCRFPSQLCCHLPWQRLPTCATCPEVEIGSDCGL